MIVAVDAGHGGIDPGARPDSTRIPEHQLVMPYTGFIGRVLSDAGHRIVYTRPLLSSTVEIQERADRANEVGADLFVSIHANASDNEKAHGPWTLYARGSKKGQAIATEIQATAARVLKGDPKAVYPDGPPYTNFKRLGVLWQTKMPAVLIELGFLTNKEDYDRLTSRDVQLRVASALACTLVGPRIMEVLNG